MAPESRDLTRVPLHLRPSVFWADKGIIVPLFTAPQKEAPFLNAYQIYVPEDHRIPNGLRTFPLSPGEIVNVYLFQAASGVPVNNTVEHVGFRNVTFKRPDLPEGLTFNEYVIAAKTHPEFRTLVEGKWVKVSGSVSPKGGILHVLMDPSDRSLISYFGDNIKGALDFSSCAA